MKVFSFIAMVLIISSCTSKPDTPSGQCFIMFERIGPQDDYLPSVIISNFNAPDSLSRRHQFRYIQVSVKEYERIRRIIKLKNNIKPDNYGETNFTWGSLEVVEYCNSSLIYKTA